MFLAPYGHDEIEVERIALNMKQVRQYNPPPNPAKQTDSRFKDYSKKHGNNCWELDALQPPVIDKLITDRIISYRDDELWDEAVSEELTHRDSISVCAEQWEDVNRFLTTHPEDREFYDRCAERRNEVQRFLDKPKRQVKKTKPKKRS